MNYEFYTTFCAAEIKIFSFRPKVIKLIPLSPVVSVFFLVNLFRHIVNLYTFIINMRTPTIRNSVKIPRTASNTARTLFATVQ